MVAPYTAVLYLAIEVAGEAYLSGNFNGNILYSVDDHGTSRVSGVDDSVQAPCPRNSFAITT